MMMSEINNNQPPFPVTPRRKPGRHRIRPVLLVILSLLGLCLFLVAASWLGNLVAPLKAETSDHLTALDKAHLAEALHLQHTLGGQVLPDWDQADIPIILFNERTIYLTGISNPPDGWEKIPSGKQLGLPWEQLQNDDFFGQPYYRQEYTEPNANTQAFTVLIGDRWTASMGTYDYMKVSLVDQFQQMLPSPLNRILPYRLLIQLFLPPDMYIGAVLHESVHAYQGMRAADRLNEAERIYIEFGDQYPVADEAFVQDWQIELDLLADAMSAETDREAAALARDFLEQRASRRKIAGLSPELIAVERSREWEEGLAKYGELSSMLAAANSANYRPVPEIALDKGFNAYRGAGKKWQQEIQQIRRMADDDGDGRFYYSGFAQAALLDRLYPGWKDLIFDQDIWLEDLLAHVVSDNTP